MDSFIYSIMIDAVRLLCSSITVDLDFFIFYLILKGDLNPKEAVRALHVQYTRAQSVQSDPHVSSPNAVRSCLTNPPSRKSSKKEWGNQNRARCRKCRSDCFLPGHWNAHWSTSRHDSYTQIQPKKRRKSDICARTFSVLFGKQVSRKKFFSGRKKYICER